MSDISDLSPEEFVILLDQKGHSIGIAPKRTVHCRETPLHAAFSVFLFNDRGETLLQQRSLAKLTWPGVWSNACCGHPQPGESVHQAAQRRLREELSLVVPDLTLVLPDFRYRAEHRGVVENELCPVFIGTCTQTPNPDPEEVAALRWIPWRVFARACLHAESMVLKDYSPWSVLEARLLASAPEVSFLTARKLA